MSILLAFAPFIVFAVLDRFVGSLAGLVAAAIVSIVLLVREWSGGRTPKTLEIGSAILFGGLAAYVYFSAGDLPLMGVRLLVDIGLLAIVLISIAISMPFTMQYAREKVAQQYWRSPEFRQTNLTITWVWAAAFAVLVIADAVLLYVPDAPPAVGTVVIIGTLVAAVKFTAWYPKQRKQVKPE